MAVTDQDLRAVQEGLRKLQQDIASIRSSAVNKEKKQLKYPVDADTQAIINGLIDVRLNSVLYDKMWKRVFRWYEPFDSLDNWAVSPLTDLGVAPTMGALIVQSDAILNDQGFAARLLDNPNVINSFDRDNAFRVSFYIKNGPMGGSYYITVGDHLVGTRNFYGFKIVNGGLYGVISAHGTATEVLTKQLAAIKNFDTSAEAYVIEARYRAGVKVDFFVTVNTNTGTSPATIAANPIASLNSPIAIPALPNFVADTPYVFSFSATSLDADVKDLYLLDLDYIQRLEIS